MKRIFVIIIVMFLLLISSNYFAFAEDSVIVTNEAELIEAVRYSGNNIIINDIIHIEDVIIIENPITIGGTGTITVSDNHRHFRVYSQLTLRDEITLTRADGYSGLGGGIDSTREIIENRSTLVMHGGRIYNNAAGYGGGIRFSGDFVMYEGMIIGNTAERDGGGIYLGGSFEMHGGKIVGNAAGRDGGGVFSRMRFFHMHGGEIVENFAERHGGGVYSIMGRVTMYNGKINENTAVHSGGGVHFIPEAFWSWNTTFIMHDGEINGNTAGTLGGGIYFRGRPSNSLFLNRGQISYNTAAADGGVSAAEPFGFSVGNPDNMRIFNNTPANNHDAVEGFTFMRFITPDAYRIIAIFVIALLGIFITFIRRKGKMVQ